ncbi:L,D-transpeptidase, partial [Salmonella enterica subsp. enterica serovar Istanbul]|nr:L,D-transpeptidase [Salmonella enterica subsp. enterica serovar Istanbul]
PSILRGLNDDGSKYASKVQYWSPFTDSGCGFHDASWRHDWSKQAYLAKGGGSHGCINMHPDVAGQAFHDLQKNEPVIIY